MDTIAEWSLGLFLIWYGLAAFVPALSTDMFKKIGGVLALVAGVFGLIVFLSGR